MSVSILTAIREATRYEENLSRLYLVFHETFSEDADLWWELSVSELGHAAMLRSGEALFADDFHTESIEADLGLLRKRNQELESTIERVSQKPLIREAVFRLALELENSENEKILHRIFETQGRSQARSIVNRISSEDRTHAEQIRSYALKAGLTL